MNPELTKERRETKIGAWSENSNEREVEKEGFRERTEKIGNKAWMATVKVENSNPATSEHESWII